MAAILGLRAIHPMEALRSNALNYSSPALLISIMAQDQAAGLFIQTLNYLQTLSNTLLGWNLPLQLRID